VAAKYQTNKRTQKDLTHLGAAPNQYAKVASAERIGRRWRFSELNWHSPYPADVALVHSSDIHVDDAHLATDGTARLCSVLATARALKADIVLLAGDTFENNQLSPAVLDQAAQALAEAGLPIVILPGNHDPALPDSVFIRGGFDRIPGVRILGVTDDEAVPFPAVDLEIWGHAHRDYYNMEPLRGPRPRSTRWQVAMAHGHYEPPETRANPLRPSWIFGDE
jgi:predicted MPP superfamily phosphohydrolase